MEFVEVMEKLQEMCNSIDYCKQCPMNQLKIAHEKSCLCVAQWASEEVEEVVSKWNSVDWSKVKVDTKILVKEHYDGDWYKRYFAKYENGNVYAFADGCTSWSAAGDVSGWNYAKLAEEEE